jgi:hypothetical protein
MARGARAFAYAQRSRWALVGFLALASACSGAVTGSADRASAPTSASGAPEGPGGAAGGSGSGATPPQSEDGFACDEALGPSVSPLRRLSALQYQNTLRDLFGAALDVETVAAAELARVPVDDAAFRIMDSRLSDQHVRAYQRIADRLASSATAAAPLRAIVGDCASDAMPSTACVDAFLDDFGTRAFRRPLSAEERAAYLALDDGSRDSQELFRALLFVILQSPALLYHVEVDGEPIGGDDDYYRLPAYELASRLSYHFWQTMPDAELFAAAEDGSLLQDEGYAAQVERMFADERTREALAAFYTEWWHLGWLNEFPDTPAFRTLAEGTTVFEPGADHLQAMNDEILAMVEHFTFSSPGKLQDLLLTDLSFTRSPHLSALYGVEPWDGSSALPRLPAGERAGILTRGAFLVNDNHTTHPIHRGVTVKRRLLCQVLPQPDPASLPNGALVPPPITPDATTRERYETKTSPALCSSCHGSFNPIGFVLERYDALGRHRSEERVLDEATGEVLATLPIDSSAAPKINAGDDRVIATGPELSEMVAASPELEPCFARQYFRFTYAREEVDRDGCALEAVRSALTGDGDLAKALRAIALEASFRARRAM